MPLSVKTRKLAILFINPDNAWNAVVVSKCVPILKVFLTIAATMHFPVRFTQSKPIVPTEQATMTITVISYTFSITTCSTKTATIPWVVKPSALLKFLTTNCKLVLTVKNGYKRKSRKTIQSSGFFVSDCISMLVKRCFSDNLAKPLRDGSRHLCLCWQRHAILREPYRETSSKERPVRQPYAAN